MSQTIDFSLPSRKEKKKKENNPPLHYLLFVIRDKKKSQSLTYWSDCWYLK